MNIIEASETWGTTEALNMGVARGERERLILLENDPTIEDLDDIFNNIPGPLSGEFADDMTPSDLVDEILSMDYDIEACEDDVKNYILEVLAEEYERGYWEAVHGEATACKISYRGICEESGT